MKTYLVLALATSCLCLQAAAQESLRTFELSPNGAVNVTTDLMLKKTGMSVFLYSPVSGADLNSVSAFDVSQGKKLEVHRKKTEIAVSLPYVLKDKAEFRLRLHEMFPGSGTRLHRSLEQGRYVFVLPAGYVLKGCSMPAQIRTSQDHVSVGIVQGSKMPVTLDLEMQQEANVKNVPFDGNFLAMDDRVVSYQLLDPKDHAIRLWLELYVDKPGQSHFYSQLRIPDHIANPVTLDVDRGVELPTRILSGKDATAIGDAPALFPDDAQVLVADLGYSVQKGGSARVRSYQTATDAPNYRLTAPDEFRLDRFIARTRTQYILPAGWSLASMDQPGTISTSADGRVTIDFVGSSAQQSHLAIVGHRNTSTQ